MLLTVFIMLNSLAGGVVYCGQRLEIPVAVQTAVRYAGQVTSQAEQGTRLQSLVRENDAQVASLPQDDSADPRPLPGWFRVFLRKNFPDLPKSGRPQYPEDAVHLLKWLNANPNFSKNELDARLAKLREFVPGVIRENEKRAKYPKEWEVEVPKDTKLDRLRQSLDDEFDLLPPKDLEDKTPLPIWFRGDFRKKNPTLATSGPYQYPRTANRILRWLVSHPNSFDEEQKQ